MVSLSGRGICLKGRGLCPEHFCQGDPLVWVTYERYASYWNVFLHLRVISIRASMFIFYVIFISFSKSI